MSAATLMSACHDDALHEVDAPAACKMQAIVLRRHSAGILMVMMYVYCFSSKIGGPFLYDEERPRKVHCFRVVYAHMRKRRRSATWPSCCLLLSRAPQAAAFIRLLLPSKEKILLFH